MCALAPSGKFCHSEILELALGKVLDLVAMIGHVIFPH